MNYPWTINFNESMAIQFNITDKDNDIILYGECSTIENAIAFINLLQRNKDDIRINVRSFEKLKFKLELYDDLEPGWRKGQDELENYIQNVVDRKFE